MCTDVNEVSQTGLLKTFVRCRLCVRKCGYALERIDHDKVIESCVEKMGLVALEWIEAGCKTQAWMKSEESVPFSLNMESCIIHLSSCA